jgi:hypothetical protein
MPERGPLHATGVKVVLSQPVHVRLTVLRDELIGVKGRDVTFSEAIEGLLRLLDEAPRGMETVAR